MKLAFDFRVATTAAMAVVLTASNGGGTGGVLVAAGGDESKLRCKQWENACLKGDDDLIAFMACLDFKFKIDCPALCDEVKKEKKKEKCIKKANKVLKKTGIKEKECDDEPCDPVVCDNGKKVKEFRNLCEAKRKGYDDKQCEPREQNPCPEIYDPVVCDGDGNEYSSQCDAYETCLYKEKDCFKLIDPGCTKQYEPCVCDGTKYDNDCKAVEAGCITKCYPLPPWVNEEPRIPLICPEIYEPCVCGGTVYDNECFAAEDRCKAICLPVDEVCPDCKPVVCEDKDGNEKEFRNKCLAKLFGYKKCEKREPNFCPAYIDPVICGGEDGTRYNTQCDAYNACLYEPKDCEKLNDIICTEEHDPCVCGNIGLFSNPCYASAAGCKATCEPIDKVCPDCEPVVCEDKDGNEREFRNKCQADLYGYGDCEKRKPNFCPAYIDPVVCGEDGTQYNTQCDAYNACLYESEDCEKLNDIVCTEEHDPCVCGNIGLFSNPCYASAAGCKAICEPIDEVCPDCEPVVCMGGKDGEDEREFRNRCQADLYGYGKCEKREPTPCLAVDDPVVCGEKEILYSNQCYAYNACLYENEDCEKP